LAEGEKLSIQKEKSLAIAKKWLLSPIAENCRLESSKNKTSSEPLY